MTKYTPIEFTKLSEAIAYVENGGELYDPVRDAPMSRRDIVDAFEINLAMYTKAKPVAWYEKLDGTVENGVLCRSDITGVVFLCVKFYADNFYDDQDNRMSLEYLQLRQPESWAYLSWFGIVVRYKQLRGHSYIRPVC